MAFTYDVTTDRGKVRMLITDVESTDPCFDDDEIDAYLSMASSNVYRAASVALLTIAANETLVQKRIKLLDLTTDGPAEAEALRKLAGEYKSMAEDSDTASSGFGWAEMVFDAATYSEKVRKEALRGE